MSKQTNAESKENIFNSAVQYPGKHTSSVQQQDHRSRHRVNRQEELLMKEGEEVGGW